MIGMFNHLLIAQHSGTITILRSWLNPQGNWNTWSFFLWPQAKQYTYQGTNHLRLGIHMHFSLMHIMKLMSQYGWWNDLVEPQHEISNWRNFSNLLSGDGKFPNKHVRKKNMEKKESTLKQAKKTTRNSQGMQNIWRKPTTSGKGIHHSTSEPTKFGGPLIRAIKQTHLSCSVRLIPFRRGIQIIQSWWS